MNKERGPHIMKKIQSFTLLESIFFIILISVMAGIGIPGCRKALENSKERTAAIKFQTIIEGIKIYKAKHGSYPDFDMLDITSINQNLQLNIVPDRMNYSCYQQTRENVPECKMTSPKGWAVNWHDSENGENIICSTGPCPNYPYAHDD